MTSEQTTISIKPLNMKKLLSISILILFGIQQLPLLAQTGLYVASAKPVKDMNKVLATYPETFYLVMEFGMDTTLTLSDLDMLDSVYNYAFLNRENPNFYTMTVEGYADGDEQMMEARCNAVYNYFCRRSYSPFPIRIAYNPIHCSCHGDTVESLRYEVPATVNVLNMADLPESRQTLNKTIQLKGNVLVTFRNNPDECIGTSRGCFLPANDTVIHGYYASLAIQKGAVYAVQNTKDTCPPQLEIKIEEHLDYKEIVERYSLIPHRKYIILQAGYVVLHSNSSRKIGECTAKLPDSIYVRFPFTPEQWAGKLRIYSKVVNNKGQLEYKALSTKKLKSKDKTKITVQSAINATQLDTVYLGKRIQPDELSSYFYPAISEVEEGSFEFGRKYYKAFRVNKHGDYEIKPALRDLFRIIEQEEDDEDVPQPPKKPKKGADEEI